MAAARKRLDPEERNALQKTRSAIRVARRAIARVKEAGGWWGDVDEGLRSDLEAAARRFGDDIDSVEVSIAEIYP